jgi:hypothetical protein
MFSRFPGRPECDGLILFLANGRYDCCDQRNEQFGDIQCDD